MNPRLFLLTAAAIGSLDAAAEAGVTYTQNFDSMGTAGTAAPSGWTEISLSGSHEDFRYAGSSASITTTVLPGDGPTYIAKGPAGTSTLTTNAALTAGSAGYNFATTASATDRALGTSPSGNAESQLQLTLTNTDPTPAASFSVGYDIRRFSTTANNNTGYTGADVGLEELPGYWLFYSLDNGVNWTNVSSLNPTKAGPAGVVVPNTVGVTSVPVTSVPLATPLAGGGTLLLRWVDDNAESPSPDQLIGLDNVTIAVPEPASVALLGGVAMALRRRRRA